MKNKYTVYKNKKYKLVGRCVICGNCCRFRIAYSGEDVGDGDIRVGNDGIYVSYDNKQCEHFNEIGNKCNINNNKPKICSEFPRLYKELELADCQGYKWEYVNDTFDEDTKIIMNEKDRSGYENK